MSKSYETVIQENEDKKLYEHLEQGVECVDCKYCDECDNENCRLKVEE